MNKIFLFILDLFFPNRCPICNKIIPYDGLVCPECEKLLSEDIVTPDVCGLCGKNRCVCGNNLNYSRTAALYFYENAAKKGILSLKDGGRQFGVFLGRRLGEKILGDDELRNADIITAVPMDRKKRRKRGYNQAAVIAEEISKVTGIPYEEGMIVKMPSEVQHTLKAPERRKNAEHSFNVNDKYSFENLNGKKIIICDDVLTTGSTIDRCAFLLKKMNASEVYAAVGTTTIFK